MRRNAIVATICLLAILLCAGCSGSAVDAEALYGKIESGMSIDKVLTVMDGHKPLTESESTIDTAIGKVVMKTMSWKIGKHLITVIFENGVLQSRDLTKM